MPEKRVSLDLSNGLSVIWRIKDQPQQTSNITKTLAMLVDQSLQGKPNFLHPQLVPPPVSGSLRSAKLKKQIDQEEGIWTICLGIQIGSR